MILLTCIYYICYLLVTGLEINFEEDDYSIEEGGTLNSVIRLQFRQNQNQFTVRLCPVSIDTAEVMNLGSFIDCDTIDEISRATPGGLLKCPLYSTAQ